MKVALIKALYGSLVLHAGLPVVHRIEGDSTAELAMVILLLLVLLANSLSIRLRR